MVLLAELRENLENNEPYNRTAFVKPKQSPTEWVCFGRGDTAKWMSFVASDEAKDMELVSTTPALSSAGTLAAASVPNATAKRHLAFG